MSKQATRCVPMDIARAAGARSSSWVKLGDGPWHGTVIDQDEKELTVEQLASGWKVTDETGSSSTAAELALALIKSGLRP